MQRRIYSLGSCCQTDLKQGSTEFVAPTGCIQSSLSGQQYQISDHYVFECHLLDLLSWVSAELMQIKVSSVNLCADYSHNIIAHTVHV